MSAKAEESTLPMKEMLKPTGFIAPDSVADKTFTEATEGGGIPEHQHLTIWKADVPTGVKGVPSLFVYTLKENPSVGDYAISIFDTTVTSTPFLIVEAYTNIIQSIVDADTITCFNGTVYKRQSPRVVQLS